MGVSVAPETSCSVPSTELGFAPFKRWPGPASEDVLVLLGRNGRGKAERGEETQTTRSRARRKDGRVL